MVLNDPEGMALPHQLPKQVQDLFRLPLGKSEAGLVQEEKTRANGFRPGEPSGEGDATPLAQRQVSPPLSKAARTHSQPAQFSQAGTQKSAVRKPTQEFRKRGLQPFPEAALAQAQIEKVVPKP